MRTNRGADALFPEIRKRVLAALLMQPGRSWYASDLARHVRAPKTSLQRELSNLHAAGIIRRRVEGKHVYYTADTDCPFFPELKGLMAKTAGLVDVLREIFRPLAKRISLAFVYGSIARGDEDSGSDVDLMVVGGAGLSDLALPLRRASGALGRQVNPTVLSPMEFAKRAAAGKGFIAAVLDKPKLFVVGNKDDLEEVIGTKTGGSGGSDKARDRRSTGSRLASARRRND